MRIYTPSGIEIDITIDEKGEIHVNSNVPDRNYYSDAAMLKGIYEDMREILDVVKKEFPELRGEISQGQMYNGMIAEKHNNKANNTEHKTGRQEVPHHTKKANGNYKWIPLNNTMGYIEPVTTYEVTPVPILIEKDNSFWTSSRIPNENAFKDAAELLGVSVATIKAVYETEVGDSAYISDGRMKILFERHYFHRLTKGKYDKEYPDISNKVRGGYGKYSEEYKKLEKATTLDKEAAYASVSWGAFQIMGANYKDAGYSSAVEFGEAMQKGGEDAQLKAFVNLIKVHPAWRQKLIQKDWTGFAKLYNGSSYKENKYDTKLKTNYDNASKEDKDL